MILLLALLLAASTAGAQMGAIDRAIASHAAGDLSMAAGAIRQALIKQTLTARADTLNVRGLWGIWVEYGPHLGREKEYSAALRYSILGSLVNLGEPMEVAFMPTINNSRDYPDGAGCFFGTQNRCSFRLKHADKTTSTILLTRGFKGGRTD